MKVSRMVSLLCGVGLACSSVFAAPDPNFHIYLAFGQSNMEGQGTIESQDKTVDPRFQMLSTIDNFNGRKLGTWNDAIPPLANKHGGLGPTDYFGRTLVKELDPQIKVGVVVVAIAGCSIVAFDSPLDQSYMSTQAGWFKDIVKDYGDDPYQRLVEMAKKAKEDGVIKGIIFHQGETDEGDSDWPNKVKKVYDRLVKDIGLDENIPFFAGEVPYQGSSKGTNNNIRKLPSKSKNFYLVSAEGLNDLDMMRIHFSSQGYRDFGKRYAEKVMEVLGDDLKPVSTTPSSSSEAVSSSSEVASSSSAAPTSSATEPSSSATEAIATANVSRALSVGNILSDGNMLQIPLTIARAGVVNIRLYSVLGYEVANIYDLMYAGSKNISIPKKHIPAGIYMLSVQTGPSRITKQIDLSR
jgi:hypothetical protein